MEHLEMLPPLQPPAKEVDVDFLVFVERYATDLLKWDILTFFGHNPDFNGSTEEIAQQIGRSSQSLRPELGDLALMGILQQIHNPDKPEVIYQLAQDPDLKRMILKLAKSQEE
jgi:hypothetical protein